MSSFAPSATNKTPRVGIVGRLDNPGGVQSVILSLIKGLNRRGIQPDILWDTPPSQDLLKTKGARAGYHPIHFRASTRILDRVPATARYILQAGNCFYSSETSGAYDFYFIFYNGFLVNDGVPHLRYLSGPPLLPQLELSSPGLRGAPFRFLRQVYQQGLRKRYPIYEFHRNSPYVINSEYTADLFEQAHGVRLPVVHPPIDLSGHSFSADDLSRRDTITFFSRFVDYKRPELVLQLAKCYPDFRFVLMGGVKPQNRAFYEGLIFQAQQAGLVNTAFFANPSNAKVKEELARTRFYIFPAINEHFGMATAEAIAAGAIPFVHDSGGQREIVPDPRLRFTDDHFFTQFTALLQISAADLNGIRLLLNEHVRRFSEETFIDKMVSFSDGFINR